MDGQTVGHSVITGNCTCWLLRYWSLPLPTEFSEVEGLEMHIALMHRVRKAELVDTLQPWTVRPRMLVAKSSALPVIPYRADEMMWHDLSLLSSTSGLLDASLTGDVDHARTRDVLSSSLFEQTSRQRPETTSFRNNSSPWTWKGPPLLAPHSQEKANEEQ